MRALASPRVQIAWALLVLATLGTTYRLDPYLFGAATFGLGFATVGLLAFALAALLRPAAAPRTLRRLGLGALAVAALALAVALLALRRVHWA